VAAAAVDSTEVQVDVAAAVETAAADISQ